jgi:hypothetical protein
MDERVAKRTARSPTAAADCGAEGAAPASLTRSVIASRPRWTAPYRYFLYGLDFFLIASILLATFCVGWEYSVRRYLKGFSDAVVPAGATPELKIEAILNWMKHGPARQAGGPSPLVPDRDPVETLNYESLLRVCGSATNAFINLADSGGLEARRLLLLGSDWQTKHVVAEVFVDKRWIVVDPTFHQIFRSADGDYLTRSQLADPTVFTAATRPISNYEPSYTFERTAHVHTTQIPYVGAGIRRVLNAVAPTWDETAAVSLFFERESFAAMIVSILLLVFAMLLRAFLISLGESRLNIQRTRWRMKIYRAAAALFERKNQSALQP